MEIDIKLRKPFLKWAGGKHKLVKNITAELGSAKRLVEPFVGSGAVFMGTDYDSYLLADYNKDLINLYQQIQSNFENLLAVAEAYFKAENNTEARFYELRTYFNETTSVLEKSALFIYLNKHAFNGLCRYNSSGKFNVPYGKYTSPKLPINELLAFHKKADKAEFINLDFKETFKLLKHGDVVYCDPPYIPISASSSFTAYSLSQFGVTQQTELAELAKKASKAGTKVVLSNSDTTLARELYVDSNITSLLVRRSISSKASTRGKVGEVIAVFG